MIAAMNSENAIKKTNYSKGPTVFEYLNAQGPTDFGKKFLALFLTKVYYLSTKLPSVTEFLFSCGSFKM